MNPDLAGLTYEWPPQIARYEPRVIAGLSAQEAMLATGAGLFCLALLPGLLGAVAGLVVGLLTLLVLRRIERLGNLSLPAYLWRRWRAHRAPTPVALPLVMGAEIEQIHIEDAEGVRVRLE